MSEGSWEEDAHGSPRGREKSWYQTRSVGGGGMLTAKVPASSCTSTVSSSGVLETSSIFFLMNSFSVALWKYLDLAILSTKRRIFRLVLWPLTWLRREEPQLSSRVGPGAALAFGTPSHLPQHPAGTQVPCEGLPPRARVPVGAF